MQHEITFTLLFDGQEISVRHRPNYFSNYDHFEFTSPFYPERPIPVSPTGYKSHFAPNWEVEAAPSVEAYAHELVALMMGNIRVSYCDPAQPSLF